MENEYCLSCPGYIITQKIQLKVNKLLKEKNWLQQLHYTTFNGKFQVPYQLRYIGDKCWELELPYLIECKELLLMSSEKGLELEVIDWFLIKSSRKLLVTGIFKGLRRFQQKNFCNTVDRLSNYFNEIEVVLVTNDEERKKHQLFIEHPMIKILSLTLDVKGRRTTEEKKFCFTYFKQEFNLSTYGFMAFLRNQTLDIVRQPEYQRYDSLLMIDPDLDYPFSGIGLLQGVKYLRKKRVITSNGIFNDKGDYWDLFALRGETYSYLPGPYINERTLESQKYWNILRKHLGQIKIKTWTQTESSFGGMALYHLATLREHRSIRYDTSKMDCEHVHFHSYFQKNIWICPFFMYPYLSPGKDNLFRDIDWAKFIQEFSKDNLLLPSL